MLIDIIMVICIIVLTIKVILLEVWNEKLSKRLDNVIVRNAVQHERYESDIATLSRMHSKLHLNSLYGKLAYDDTDSIKVEKED